MKCTLATALLMSIPVFVNAMKAPQRASNVVLTPLTLSLSLQFPTGAWVAGQFNPVENRIELHNQMNDQAYYDQFPALPFSSVQDIKLALDQSNDSILAVAIGTHENRHVQGIMLTDLASIKMHWFSKGESIIGLSAFYKSLSQEYFIDALIKSANKIQEKRLKFGKMNQNSVVEEQVLAPYQEQEYFSK